MWNTDCQKRFSFPDSMYFFFCADFEWSGLEILPLPWRHLPPLGKLSLTYTQAILVNHRTIFLFVLFLVCLTIVASVPNTQEGCFFVCLFLFWMYQFSKELRMVESLSLNLCILPTVKNGHSNQRSAGWITLDFQESLLFDSASASDYCWLKDWEIFRLYVSQTELIESLIMKFHSVTFFQTWINVFIYLINTYSCRHYIFNYIVLAEPK